MDYYGTIDTISEWKVVLARLPYRVIHQLHFICASPRHVLRSAHSTSGLFHPYPATCAAVLSNSHDFQYIDIDLYSTLKNKPLHFGHLGACVTLFSIKTQVVGIRCIFTATAPLFESRTEKAIPVSASRQDVIASAPSAKPAQPAQAAFYLVYGITARHQAPSHAPASTDIVSRFFCCRSARI